MSGYGTILLGALIGLAVSWINWVVSQTGSDNHKLTVRMFCFFLGSVVTSIAWFVVMYPPR